MGVLGGIGGGLLEERELAVRERVETLREEAERVLAVLADAETDWEGWK
ncbi:hypothetical protein [Streptomyces sp. NPDC090022]